jgi:hypothetical protein
LIFKAFCHFNGYGGAWFGLYVNCFGLLGDLPKDRRYIINNVG